MDNLSYYFSIFRRRSPYFLIVATLISAIAVTVAYTLPPAYESRMVLLVEAPQIPEELAASTVQTPAFEQLQIIQHRLLTRANMLDTARKFDVLPGVDTMVADDIVDAMRARTTIKTSNQRRQEAPLMTITFEAPRARAAAEVLNEYLLIIQQQDTEFRKGRSGETLTFFTQEVERLSNELDLQSARILEFKQANSGSLPESLQFRMDQQATFQDRLLQIDRDVADLRNQKTRLLQLFELTGNVQTNTAVELSPDERQRDALKKELEAALAVLSSENPKVKALQARLDQVEAKIAAAAPAVVSSESDTDEPAEMPPMLVVQLSELDSRVASLEAQKGAVQRELEDLRSTIFQTPSVAITLEELERSYAGLQDQFQQAQSRLALAQTGDLIESRSRGQRLSVVEQPAVPSSPTKPNRIMLAGGGTAFGILAGLAVIFLLEWLNSTARRPEDLVNKLGVTPLTTIPYIQTRGQKFRHRSLKLLVLLAIVTVIPAAIFAIHTYYLPLDLIADRIMNKVGIRW
jgi:uncharacterized protein involved in exopolysaccharide biosynthesis